MSNEPTPDIPSTALPCTTNDDIHLVDAIRVEQFDDPNALPALDNGSLNPAWKDLIDHLVGQAIRSLMAEPTPPAPE